MKTKNILWPFFIFFAIVIGIYPIIYLLVDMTSNGLLANKNQELLSNNLYTTGFYTHISFGGLSILIGWMQFVKKWRLHYLKIHRIIGKIYIISVLLSGIAGLYISFFADGGIIATIGFAGLAITWLLTTTMAYITIKNKKINKHRDWMIRSFALTFAAVTLRILMPILPDITGLEGIESYQLVSYLCWIPNLLVAELIIKNNYKTSTKQHVL